MSGMNKLVIEPDEHNPNLYKHHFHYDGRDLEVRAELKGETWEFQVFENDKPVGNIADVSYQKKRDAETEYKFGFFEDMIRTVKCDIINRL